MSEAEDVLMLENTLIPDVPQPEAALILEAGYLYMEMGGLKEAEEIFEGMAALLPQSDMPRVALGDLFFAQGKFQRALKFHQEALKVRPESAMAQARVGEALLWLKKTDEGLEALNKAIEMEGDGPGGQFAKAVIEAHEAGELEIG
jgi:tetratricopeptide (TPR) repeat protein